MTREELRRMIVEVLEERQRRLQEISPDPPAGRGFAFQQQAAPPESGFEVGAPPDRSRRDSGVMVGDPPDRSVQGQGLSVMEIVVALSAVVMTVASVAMAVWMRVRGTMDADRTFQLVGLSLALGASLFLIGAGYGQDQIAPAMGFLGTALGFIFGKGSAAAAAPPSPSAPSAS